jgi:hypothetical protein
MTPDNARKPISPAKQADLDARDRFMADCGDHQMTVLHDDGLYRHLLFRSPGSLDRFEVITWPGHLTLNGGHGTWTFARTDDMFEFFRSSQGLTRINPGYWGEKLRGGLTSGNALTEEYDPDVYHAEVKRWLDDFIESCDWPDEVIEDLRAEVATQLTDDWLDWTHEDGARDLLDRFQFATARRRVRLEDVWEWELRKPSSHFLWSCWAVAFAVDQYDRAHVTRPAGGGA